MLFNFVAIHFVIKVSYREPDGQVHVQISLKAAPHFCAHSQRSRRDLVSNSLVIVSYSSELVIEVPVMPAEGPRPISFVGSCLVLLGLALA